MADELDDSFLDGALDDFEQLTTPADTSFLRPSPVAPPPAAAAGPAPSTSSAPPSPPAAASEQPKKPPAFDPLAKKSSKGARKAAASAGRAGPGTASTSQEAGSASAAAAAVSSTGGHKLPPELENLAAELAKLIAETQPDAPDTPGPASTSAPASSSTSRGAPPAPGMASTAASLQALQEVRQQAVAAQGALPAPGGGGGGGMFGGMLPDMEGMQEPGMNAIVDSIMQHLLSKDVLQQPMQEIRDCYPPWLEKNRGRIPDADLERYTKQYGFIQEICALYDQEPDNYAKLVSLMQQMQACGEPPEDIVREMSSGLEHVPPGEAEGAGADDEQFDLRLLQQEINKCPVQ